MPRKRTVREPPAEAAAVALPKWRQTSAGWECDEPDELDLAADTTIRFGFDLPMFDTWLAALPPCVAKEELLSRRAQAKRAWYGDDEASFRRHLEFLLVRSRELRREDVLLPLAKAGADYKEAQGARARQPRSVTDETLRRFLDRDYRVNKTRWGSTRRAARHFGVAESTIARRKKKLA